MIIHGPLDPANQAGLAVKGLRRIGASAEAVVTPNPFAYPGPNVEIPGRRLARMRCVAPRLLRCDVLHLHAGQSLFPGRLARADARFVRRRRRRVVMEFAGSEARLPSTAGADNPHYVPPETCDEAAIERSLAEWAALCGGHAIVADHNLDRELQRHFDRLHVVGLRVDTASFEPAPPAVTARRPVLVHAPSNPRIKGTLAVRRSVRELRSTGLDFEYVEVHGLAHDAARRIYARADLVVDQLCIGAHGVFALEAMSLAKPVVCYIRPDLVGRYPPDLPLINANPDSLTPVLADWLTRPADRRELGIASRTYAEREHDIAVVARRLLDAYEQLPRS
jgi:hypothetical protein